MHGQTKTVVSPALAQSTAAIVSVATAPDSSPSVPGRKPKRTLSTVDLTTSEADPTNNAGPSNAKASKRKPKSPKANPSKAKAVKASAAPARASKASTSKATKSEPLSGDGRGSTHVSPLSITSQASQSEQAPPSALMPSVGKGAYMAPPPPGAGNLFMLPLAIALPTTTPTPVGPSSTSRVAVEKEIWTLEDALIGGGTSASTHVPYLNRWLRREEIDLGQVFGQIDLSDGDPLVQVGRASDHKNRIQAAKKAIADEKKKHREDEKNKLKEKKKGKGKKRKLGDVDGANDDDEGDEDEDEDEDYLDDDVDEFDSDGEEYI